MTEVLTMGMSVGDEMGAQAWLEERVMCWREAGWSVVMSEVSPDPHARPLITLTLSRPEALNALSLGAIKVFHELVAWLECLEAEQSLGAVILTGAGGRFIAGGDLKELHNVKASEEARELSASLQHTLSRLSALKAPVLSAIEGFAIGGGAEVALATDLCVMARDAYVRFAQRGLGLCTAWGGSRHLARAVGPRQAFALLSRNDKIYADEALSLGVAHRLSEPGEALKVATEWASALASTPEASAALKALTLQPASSIEEEQSAERERFEQLWTASQHWARVEAFWDQQRARRLTSTPAPVSSTQPSTKRGLFVVFEGIDGAGTTTQAQLLTQAISALGEVAHFTNEPSEGVIGALTRRALRGETLGREGRPLPSEAIALMFAADRADHWRNEIEPRLARGEHVICDRYLYSSIAYQGLEHPEAWVRGLNNPFPAPDLLIYLQASASLGAERRAARGGAPDRYEVDELQEKIALAYDRLCAEAGALTLNAALSIEDLAERCLRAFEHTASLEESVTT